jgi:hypothetical protein
VVKVALDIYGYAFERILRARSWKSLRSSRRQSVTVSIRVGSKLSTVVRLPHWFLCSSCDDDVTIPLTLDDQSCEESQYCRPRP